MSVPTPPDWPQITDVSSLDAEDFKLRNTKFLQDSNQPYETGRGDTPEALREEIWRVRNGDLRTVLREFPTHEPLREQCALWMHAVAGKHFFPDANHRTAIALLRRLLAENDIEYEPWDIDRLRRARVDSHHVRQEITPVELDTSTVETRSTNSGLNSSSTNSSWFAKQTEPVYSSSGSSARA